MLLVSHPLDPNLIDWGSDYEHYILGGDDGDIRARVDAEDYWHFCHWRWAVKFDKRGKKPYLFRTVTDRGAGLKYSLYLHVAILKRHRPERPDGHTIVDHADGDTLECRKFNLDYATPSMNAKNRRTQSHRVDGRLRGDTPPNNGRLVV